jgi:hypothetical protein
MNQISNSWEKVFRDRESNPTGPKARLLSFGVELEALLTDEVEVITMVKSY